MADYIPSNNGTQKAKTRQMYDFTSGIYNRFGLLFDRKRFNHITDYLDIGQEHSLLDAGTGPGTIPFALRKLGYTNEITGIDLSPNMINRAMHRASRITGNHFRFIVADMENIPFPDSSFDRLTCVDSLLLVNDKAKVMHEFKRVLKDGGKGLIVEPTSGGKRKRTSYTAFHLFLKISSLFKKDLRGLSVSDYRGKSYMSPVEIECLVKESGMSVLNLVEKDTHTFCVFIRNG